MIRKPKTCWIMTAAMLMFGGFVSAEESEQPAEEASYSEEERSFWSLQPRSQLAIPRFDDETSQRWIQNPIDAFILQGLQNAKLAPAGQASKAVLYRRAHFDLLGLPPTPESLQRFLQDNSPTAWSVAIERMLADPRSGEHWAQHWLDVVRYSETEGFEYDRHRPGAWRYRDYVIRSFNEDKPYDQFLIEQLAGDELAEPPQITTADAAQLESSGKLDPWIAVGFHRLGPVRRNAGNPEVAFSRNEILTEMTDIIGSAILGMTVGCARCHDHMYDPIRQTDYYQLQAFLAETHEHSVPLLNQTEADQHQALIDDIDAKIKPLKKELANASGKRKEELLKQIKALQGQIPPPIPSIFTVKNDASQRTAIHLLKRGDETKPLQPLTAAVLGVLRQNKKPASSQSQFKGPRHQLALWITDPQHPLTARVMANRVWHYHFGQGLVDTPNDFGMNGSQPSHPELLDFLANELVASGWSVKALHRLIMTSSTYQQRSHVGNPAAMSVDPNNHLLWKFNRRRLSAETIRDAMLSISGSMNQSQFGQSIMVPVDEDLVNLLYKPDQWEVASHPNQYQRRSIYLIAKRNLRLPFLEVFDQPDLQTSCGARVSSTHAPQALEMLNGKLANELAEKFADRLREDAGSDPDRQVHRALELAIGRAPTDHEAKLSRQFLSRNSLREFALVVLNLNPFLYID
ncbi:MAG: hypothetical protein CMJ78_06335 [Planctomycetaceae bacterium]|nr:hypothetical protein [Planctomycetaceae bacterium]